MPAACPATTATAQDLRHPRRPRRRASAIPVADQGRRPAAAARACASSNAAADFAAALGGAQREARISFGDDRVLIESYVARPRHIEIQVFADTPRQRRLTCSNATAPSSAATRRSSRKRPRPGIDARPCASAMGEAAVAAAKAVGYVGAGTVEFIAEADGASTSWR